MRRSWPGSPSCSPYWMPANPALTGGSGDAAVQPAIVAIVDGSREIRGHPGVARLLAEGPAVGIYAVCCSVAETEPPRRVRGHGSVHRCCRRDGEPARSLVARRDGRSPRWRPGDLGPTLGTGAGTTSRRHPVGRRQLIADDRVAARGASTSSHERTSSWPDGKRILDRHPHVSGSAPTARSLSIWRRTARTFWSREQPDRESQNCCKP